MQTAALFRAPPRPIPTKPLGRLYAEELISSFLAESFHPVEEHKAQTALDWLRALPTESPHVP